MTELALSLVLLGLAGLHAYWGIGGFWPGHDSASLARTVAGFRGIVRMPSPSACYLVAAILLFGAILPMQISGRRDIGLPPLLAILAACGFTLVFFGRGLAAYVPAWRRLTPEQPFARLDQSVYGPLCLVLGILYSIVLFKGTIS